MKNKKGEVTSQQIVILIVIIASFSVLLYFLFSLDFGGESKKELCRNSVLLRGNSAITETIPLNCQRNYECITEDGSCEGISNPDETKTIEKSDDLYRRLADSMAECWYLFGEGKVNYAGEDLKKNNYCSVCSQIYFDDSVKEIRDETTGELVFSEGEISKDALYEYMSKAQVPGKGETYLEYLFGSNDLESLKQEASEKAGTETFGTIDLNSKNHNLVVMGITSEVGTIPWIVAAGAGTVAGAIIAVNPVGWVGTGIAIAVTSIIGSAAGATYADGIEPEISAIVLKGNGIENNFLRPTIVEANSDQFKALNCEEILTRS